MGICKKIKPSDLFKTKQKFYTKNFNKTWDWVGKTKKFSSTCNEAITRKNGYTKQQVRQYDMV